MHSRYSGRVIFFFRLNQLRYFHWGKIIVEHHRQWQEYLPGGPRRCWRRTLRRNTRAECGSKWPPFLCLSSRLFHWGRGEWYSSRNWTYHPSQSYIHCVTQGLFWRRDLTKISWTNTNRAARLLVRLPKDPFPFFLKALSLLMGESSWNEPRVNTGNKINETLDGLVFTIDRSYEKIIDRIAGTESTSTEWKRATCWIRL